jgi:hypothetical protein
MVGSFGSFLLLSGFVCLSQSIGRAGSEFQTVISETDDGRELGLYVNLLSSFVCASRKASSSNLRIKSFECHPLQDHFITRLFAIVVKVTKLSFFLVSHWQTDLGTILQKSKRH